MANDPVITLQMHTHGRTVIRVDPAAARELARVFQIIAEDPKTWAIIGYPGDTLAISGLDA